MEGPSTTTLCLSGLLGTVAVAVIYKRLGFGHRWPPSVPYLPFLGSYPYLGDDLPKAICRYKEELGPIFTVYLGRERVVVLGTYELIKEAFLSRAHAFSGRVQPSPLDFLSEEGIIGTDPESNPHWIKHKKIAINALVEFGMGNREVIEQKVQVEMDHVINAIVSHQGAAFSISNTISCAVANVVSSMLFGKRFEYSDPDFIELLSIQEQAFSDSCDIGLALHFPLLKYLPGDVFNLKLLDSIGKRMKAFFKKKIDQHRDTYDPDVHRDIIDLYLSQQKQLQSEGKGNQLTDTALQHGVSDIFAGGSGTTALTLQWGIIFLVRYPDVQRQVQTELDSVIGRRGEVNMSHVQDLPYTNAFIHEVQRFADLNPFSLNHRLLERVDIGGYTLPRGTTIMPLFYAVHTDKDIWATPHSFNPQHFLNPDGSFKKMKQLTTFSYGKRACPGEPLARMQLFLYFTKLLQRFTFTVGPGEEIPGVGFKLGMDRMPLPFKIGAIDRWEAD